MSRIANFWIGVFCGIGLALASWQEWLFPQDAHSTAQKAVQEASSDE